MGAVGDEIRITGIHLYPLKSAAAFSVHHADLDSIGLVGDRRWMLVDLQGKPLTQRELPRLARLHAIPAPAGGLEVGLLALGAARGYVRYLADYADHAQVAAPAMAEGLSYNYVQLDYQRVDIDESGVSVDGDGFGVGCYGEDETPRLLRPIRKTANS